MLLYFHESVDALLVHDILIDEIGEELEVKLDHLEVNQTGLQQLGVDLLQFLYFFADVDAEAYDAVYFGMRAGKLLVEEGVVG